MSAPARKTAQTFAVLVCGLALLALLLAVSAVVPGFGFIAALFGLAVNAWAVYAFLRYRQGRQDELLCVLATAVEAGLPLAPAVRSYGHDRPRYGPTRRFFGWLAVFALPLYGYARIWLGWHSFDRLVMRFARRLERGESLSEAMWSEPGVTFRAARLAAAVGESTGALATCLRAADRERLNTAWLELAPLLVYPFLILLFASGITTFLMVFIVPKFKKIFEEFGMPLPPLTRMLVDVANWLGEYWWAVQLGALLGLIGAAVLIANPTARWHVPVLGRFYRWGMQAQILRTLGRLLAVGRSVPQALGFLADSDDLPLVAKRRLTAALTDTQRGEPLDAALRKADLLPGSMAPLVHSAEKVRTLPWALAELGDHLAGRAYRLARRVSLVVAPLLVVAVGLVIEFIAVSMFLPLIYLLKGLSEL